MKYQNNYGEIHSFPYLW